MKTYELKSFAKINLALHVTGKLTNLHKIESVIKFIDLYDTIYINEIKDALDMNVISREQFDKLAIAINTGTNIPSIATPNGQAAFLFLLTSSLAPLINLSYMRMVVMALPYTIVLSIVGFIAVVINL